MSMSVRCDGCGLEYAGAQVCRPVRPAAQRRSTGRYLGCSPRCRRSTGARGPAGRYDGADGPGPTLGEFVAEGGYSRYFARHFLMPLVVGRLVVRTAPRVGVPGPLPVPVPRPSRHAHRQRLAGLAHRRRRFPALRRGSGEGARQPCVPPRRCGRSAVRRRGVRRPRRRRRGGTLRRRGGRHPPGPGAAAARRPDPGRARGARRVPLLAATDAVLHTDASVLPARHRCPGHLELPACPSCDPPAGRRAGQLRHEPAAAARRTTPFIVTLNADDQRRPATR